LRIEYKTLVVILLYGNFYFIYNGNGGADETTASRSTGFGKLLSVEVY